MKKKLLALLLCMILAAGLLSASAAEAEKAEDIVILYENDVHCSLEGYSKLSAMKKELQLIHEYVGVVSSGDYIQGNSLGVISEGEYVVELMNLVGYDALTLGNHEFDYQLPRLQELAELMNTKPICCNFKKLGEEESFFEPYSIVSYGDTDIAYIGVTTPTTLSQSVPVQFKDEQGNFIYTFSADNIWDVAQESIDAAKAEGADYIIGLTHLGDKEASYLVTELVANTEGFDVVLDAHSHSVIESMVLTDEGGGEVVVTSTGTKFEHIGKLTISDGEITTELIPTADYTATDPVVDAHLQKINEEYSVMGDRVIAFSEVDLFTHDEEGNRLVRKEETNIGNLYADAMRSVLGADIGYVNGGGLRAEIDAGDVTFNDILNFIPFNNMPMLAEVSGQVIKDLLEMTTMSWPEENGSFPHVSGITFSVDATVPSSIVMDENELFICVDGPYRVRDIKVLNRESGEYEPLDTEKKYTLAALDYYIMEGGGGLTMLEEAVVLRDDGVLDVELLETYITEQLGGVIGKEYEQVKRHITMITEPADEEEEYLLYEVQWGDTLWDLSRKYGCTVNDIFELNRDLIKDPNLIYVGWELKIAANI